MNMRTQRYSSRTSTVLAMIMVVIWLAFMMPGLSADKLMAKMTHKVYFKLKCNGSKKGQIVIGLYGDIVPKTVKNFIGLSTGKKRFGYKNSIFHRIVPDFMVQGGDFENNDGTGGRAFNPNKVFDDENFLLSHSTKGIVSMANKGPNSNTSQFFITLKPTPWLDGKHVVFGKVIEGFEIVDEMSESQSLHSGLANSPTRGKPRAKWQIYDCGEIIVDDDEKDSENESHNEPLIQEL